MSSPILVFGQNRCHPPKRMNPLCSSMVHFRWDNPTRSKKRHVGHFSRSSRSGPGILADCSRTSLPNARTTTFRSHIENRTLHEVGGTPTLLFSDTRLGGYGPSVDTRSKRIPFPSHFVVSSRSQIPANARNQSTPAAVVRRVRGSPTLMWSRNPIPPSSRAFSATMTFATEPNNVRFTAKCAQQCPGRTVEPQP